MLLWLIKSRKVGMRGGVIAQRKSVCAHFLHFISVKVQTRGISTGVFADTWVPVYFRENLLECINIVMHTGFVNDRLHCCVQGHLQRLRGDRTGDRLTVPKQPIELVYPDIIVVADCISYEKGCSWDAAFPKHGKCILINRTVSIIER